MSTERSEVGAPAVAVYVDRDEAVVAVDPNGGPQEVLTFDGAHLVTLHEYVYGGLGAIATITWREERPAQVAVDVHGPIAGRVQRHFVYECPVAK